MATGKQLLVTCVFVATQLGPVVGLSSFGCAPVTSSGTAADASENARRAYEAALEAYYDEDWERATLLFTEIKRAYGYTRYARLAELRLADVTFRQKKMPEAITAYKSFVHDYPNDPEIPYAKYRIVKALFAQADETFLLPPLEERDLAAVAEAYDAIRELLEEDPATKHRVELDYMLEVVAGLLARHELYVARFYLRAGNYEAAVARCSAAITLDERSGLEPEALVLLGETYLRMEEPEKAREVLRRVLVSHPTSAFTEPARRFLDRIDRTHPRKGS